MPVTRITSLFCKPSNNVAPNASITYTVGTTASTGYDTSKLVDRLADYPAKITPTAGAFTIQFTFSTAQTIELIQLIMANLACTSWFASNAAGLSLTQTFPANTRDGFPAFAYLKTTTNNTSTVWKVGVSANAPSTAIIGEVALWSSMAEAPFQFGLQHGLRYPLVQNVTEYGSPLIYKLGVRERPLVGTIVRENQRTVMLDLAQDAEGRAEPWFLVLDDTVNDSMMVRFADVQFMVKRESPLAPMDVAVEEVGLGLAP